MKNQAAVPKSKTEGHNRYPDVYQLHYPNEVKTAIREGNVFYLSCRNKMGLKVSILKSGLVKFTYTLTGEYADDFSYALSPDFANEKCKLGFDEYDAYFNIITPSVTVKINKKDLRVTILDQNKKVISEDASPFEVRTTILKGITSLKISKKSRKRDIFYGLGDKSCSTDLRGHQFQNWNTDAFGYGTKSDPLYKSIPFYYSLNKDTAHGIFLDNTYRTHFDFDSNKSDVVSFGAEGGEMNYYYIHGPELLDVARNYTTLTGTPELPPVWSLGYHQCRWSYFPEKRLMEVADTFRELNIPCDALYLDIDYMDGYRCFTWNNNLFPQPTEMIAALKKQGFHTVVMIDPCIYMDPNYEVYKDGKEKDMYCKRADGTIMNGPVWPPECAFPDYTKPAVRKWWGPLYKSLYNENKVSGFWNDMNEPAVFQVLKLTFPDDVRHDYEGQGSDHARAHNIYGMQMARATYEGLKKLNRNKRPFVITRATYAGGQRFSSAWTGDNVSNWEHLRIANIQCQRMSISGMSFIGSDIGGFVNYPGGELFVRWLQLGVFHPFYRVHSMGNNDDGSAEADQDKVAERDAVNRMDQEPWAFGKKYTPLAKSAIEFRYQLIPYMYSAFRRYAKQGDPILKPVAFYDPAAKSDEQDFIFGDKIFASPVTKSRQRKKQISLPKGDWYYWSTGKKYKGRRKVTIPTPLNEIPMFVSAGAVIPVYPVRQSTSEEITQLTLHIYHSDQGSVVSHLYEDKGEGYGYLKNDFCLKTFTVEGATKSLKVNQKSEGKFRPGYKTVKIILHGIDSNSPKCTIDGKKVQLLPDDSQKKSNYFCAVKPGFKNIKINF